MRLQSFIKLIVPVVIIILIFGCHSGNNNTQHQNTADSVLHLPGILSYTDSIKLYPDSGKYYFMRSNLLYGMKQYELSKKDLQQAIHLEPEKSMNYFGMGEIYLQQDSAAKAKGYLQKAIQLNPSDPSLQLEYDNATFLAKDYPQAIQQLKELQQKYADMADIYGLESQVYAAMKDTAKAIQALQQGIRLAPTNYDALMAMGDLLRAMNNKQCLVWYQKAEKLDTTNAEPAYTEGLYYENTGDTAQAVKAYNHSIGIDGNYADAYIAMGKLYFSQKQYSKAIEIFNLAEKVAPANAHIYLQRAYCYKAMGNKNAAINDFTRAYDFDDKLTEAKKELNQLQQTH